MVLGLLCSVVFLGVVENTILNIALPTIQADLGASTRELQWITDAYVLVFAGGVLVAGGIGDRFGRLGALRAGVAIIAVGSAIAPFATSSAQLIALRAMLGLGAALCFPTSLSILVNVFTEPVARGRAIAVWGATAGISAAAGPILGGWLVSRFSWGAVFWANVVIAIVILAGSPLLPTSRDAKARPVDVPGAALSAAGLAALTWAIIEGQRGWAQPAVLAGFALAAVLLAGFGALELRVRHPLLDLRLFRAASFTAASIVITITFLVLNGSLFVISLYLQSVVGLDPLQAGLRFLPGGLLMIAIAQLSARLVERCGTRAVVTSGTLVCAGGLFWLRTLTEQSSTVAVVAAIALFYTGLQLISAPAATALMSTVPPDRAGMGSAVNNLTRQIGAALGVALFGTVLGLADGPFVDRMSMAMTLGIGLFTIAIGISATALPGRREDR